MKKLFLLCVYIVFMFTLFSCGQKEAEKIMLLLGEEEASKTVYYPMHWDVKTGKISRGDPIAANDNETFITQIWWNGSDSLAASDPGLSSDRWNVVTADFWASCYKDSILMYPQKGAGAGDYDRQKPVLTEGDGQKREYDISGLSTPDGKYQASDLQLYAHMIDGSNIYMLFAPAMMLVEDLQLYIVEMDISTGSIKGISPFDAPWNSSPADEAGSANICSVEKEGIFFFGPKEVIKTDPKTMDIEEAFSPASFEGEVPNYLVTRVGYYDGYLLVRWRDNADIYGDYNLSAVRDGKVIATVKLDGEGRWFLPNV